MDVLVRVSEATKLVTRLAKLARHGLEAPTRASLAAYQES